MRNLKPLTLRRNFSWTFTGNLVYAACQWGMLVVIAKLGSPEMVGQFTLGFAVTAPIMMFTNLALRDILVTDAKHQYRFGDYLGLRTVSTSIALLIIAVVTFAAGYRWETSLVILLVGLAKAFESIGDVFYGLLQQNERMDRIAISLMIKGPLSLLLLGMGVYLSGGVVWGAVGLAVAWALVVFGYDLRSGIWAIDRLQTSQFSSSRTRTLDALQPRWHLQTMKKLSLLALPMGFVMMLVSLNANIPRYFIERYLGERELGIFSALAYLMTAGLMVVSPLAQSANPRLAKYYAAGNRSAFRSLLLKLVGIGALLGIAGLLISLVAGRELLTLLYGIEYAQHQDLFVYLMVAAAVNYMSAFLGYGMTATRYFLVQLPLYASVATTVAIACLWLVPSRGLQGAAIALIISAFVYTCLSFGVIVNALYGKRYSDGEEPHVD